MNGNRFPDYLNHMQQAACIDLQHVQYPTIAYAQIDINGCWARRRDGQEHPGGEIDRSLYGQSSGEKPLRHVDI